MIAAGEIGGDRIPPRNGSLLVEVIEINAEFAIAPHRSPAGWGRTPQLGSYAVQPQNGSKRMAPRISLRLRSLS